MSRSRLLRFLLLKLNRFDVLEYFFQKFFKELPSVPEESQAGTQKDPFEDEPPESERGDDMESLNSTFSPSSSILDFRQDPRNTQSLTGSIERRLRLVKIKEAYSREFKVHLAIFSIDLELRFIAEPPLEILGLDDCFEKPEEMFWKCAANF